MENSKEQKGKKNKHNLENLTKEKFSYPRLIHCTCSELQLHFPTICRSHLYDFVMDAIEISLRDINLKFISYYQLKRWVYITAKNLILNSFKRRRTFLNSNFKDLNVEEIENNYFNNISNEYGHFHGVENRLTVIAFQEEATKEELEIIEKYYYLGWKFEEVAKYMNCGISCIKARNFRMLVKFRKIMGITSHLHKKCKNK